LFIPCSETQTKLLRLERDNRELERSLQVAKQTSERVGSEMEKISRRLTAQIHADKKEIARLKEVSGITVEIGHL
jgi:predicted RNase H-like nuclease (RuvC/YqgF family)